MTSQAKRKATRHGRAALRIEAQYYREVKRFYRDWLNGYLSNLSSVLGIRFDSDEDWEMMESIAKIQLARMQLGLREFKFKLAESFAKIANLKNIVWSDAKGPVNLHVNPLVTEPWLGVELQDFVKENSMLIQKMGRETSERITTVVLDNLKTSAPRSELIAQIKAIDKSMSTNRAKFIARDQMGKLNKNITLIRARQAGVKTYEWQTMLDNRVRPSHAKLEGTIRTFGVGLEPGQDPGCRCVPVPVIE